MSKIELQNRIDNLLSKVKANWESTQKEISKLKLFAGAQEEKKEV